MATSLPPGVPNFDACTYATCPVELYGQIAYRPSLGGNAFCAAVFGIALIIQLGLGIRYRTWGFLFATVSGSVLEIIGYAGRIMLWQNDYDFNNFVIYLVCLTIGPAFYSAAIYLCLARIIAVVGRDRSKFSPKAITQFFIVCDIISLVLQAAGGALAATADTQASSSEGQHIMEAGLAFQTVSMTAFMAVCSQLLWAVQKRGSSNEESVGLRRSKGFCFFLSSKSACCPLSRTFLIVNSSVRCDHLHLCSLRIPCRRAQQGLQLQVG